MKLLDWLVNIRKDKNKTEVSLDIEADKIYLESKKEQLTEKDIEAVLERKNIDINSKEDRDQYIKESCERINEVNNVIEDIKIEYHLVIAYLADIQRIEMLALNDREKLNDPARKIVNLTGERSKFQYSVSKISDVQFRMIEKYEPEVQQIAQKMQEAEHYNNLVKNDIMHLEGEKAAIKYEIEEFTLKQNYLKKIVVMTTILAVMLLVVFYLLSTTIAINILFAYTLTVLMTAVSLVYIFFESRKNNYELKLNEKKLNKTISLLNKVKIKYINSTSNLEYTYSKYMVSNHNEFLFLWEEYMKAKDEERRYKKTADLLDFYNEELIKFLKNINISDPSIWIYQALAIIDDKEMTEIKRRLEIRRKKLRDKIDYNQRLKEWSLKDIRNLMNKFSEYKEDILEVTAKYNIVLR